MSLFMQETKRFGGLINCHALMLNWKTIETRMTTLAEYGIRSRIRAIKLPKSVPTFIMGSRTQIREKLFGPRRQPSGSTTRKGIKPMKLRGLSGGVRQARAK